MCDVISIHAISNSLAQWQYVCMYQYIICHWFITHPSYPVVPLFLLGCNQLCIIRQ